MAEGDETPRGPIAIADNESFCWCHMEPETIPKNVYRVCLECGHVSTRWTLLRAYWRESNPKRAISCLGDDETLWQKARYFVHRYTRRPSRIYFCQECIHDW